MLGIHWRWEENLKLIPLQRLLLLTSWGNCVYWTLVKEGIWNLGLLIVWIYIFCHQIQAKISILFVVKHHVLVYFFCLILCRYEGKIRENYLNENLSYKEWSSLKLACNGLRGMALWGALLVSCVPTKHTILYYTNKHI